MAKQTFTTGQVLTAAQMTSLQQTAMQGGVASAKTASYTLVAADAGSAISMSNASATTITVNTGLFAAGDTVNITNLGAGVCTITAGTATVDSSASLALAQYESGFLDFTSTSAAIFVKGAGAAAASGGMTLISTTTLSGATLNLTSIPQTYNYLQLKIVNFKPSVDGNEMTMRPNNNSGTVYRPITALSAEAALGAATQTSIKVNSYNDDTVAQGMSIVNIYNYTDTSTFKLVEVQAIGNDNATTANLSYIFTTVAFYSTSAITSLTLFVPSGNFTSGTALLYGVK